MARLRAVAGGRMRRSWLPAHLRAIAKETGVDLQVERGRQPGDYFDRAAALRAIQFFPTHLVHIEGEWAGQPFEPDLWEELALWVVFGWKRADGTRRFRRLYIEIPRKNGKSSFGAGVTLLLLFADDEPGAQIYGAAYKHEQAGIIFRIAAQMVRRSPVLSRHASVIDSSKRILEIDDVTKVPTGSFYAAIPGEEKGQHGFNAHGVMFDELHEQEDRELHDVLATSTGARRQPLFVLFSTQGIDEKSLQGQEHERARKAIAGTTEPEYEYLAIVFGLEAKDDWHKKKNWFRANPGMQHGHPKLSYIAEKVREADQVVAMQNNILRLHFNIRTAQHTRALDMSVWDRSAGYTPKLEELKGRSCYLALDMSSTTDITAAALLFPPVDDKDGTKPYQLLVDFWIPRDNIELRVRRDHVPYDVWVREGLVIATEGTAIDYRSVRQRITEHYRSLYRVEEIGYDRWGMVQLAQELDEEHFVMVPIGQGFASMSWPTKEFLRLVMEGRLQHGGNKVLRWMVDNLVLRTDPAGNLKPDKEKSVEKIDGVVAVIMAVDRALRAAGPSVYKDRGLVFVG